MEDFIVHLHLYLTNEENEFTAYQNLKRLKNYGFRILITSPKPLPSHFYEYIDYFCYDTENQILVGEYEDIEPTILWLKAGDTELRFCITKPQKHGLAVLRAMIKGCKLASVYGFKYIVRFEYDDLFGEDSMKLIENTARNVMKNKYDFHVYKNEYVGCRNDISVHLMYYSCDAFLKVFEEIIDEHTYNEYLARLGQKNQALILEQFLLSALETANTKVLYDTGENLNTLYHDTMFNIHQSDPGLKDGVLSDVMRLRIQGETVRNQVYLAAQNFSSPTVQKIHFDVFNYDNELINTYLFELDKRGWQYLPLSLDNVKTIKIKHNESEYHKVVEIDRDTKEISLFENNIRQYVLSEAVIL